MDIRILGPVEIVDGDRRLLVRASKQRALLAALILRAGQVVSTGELAERIWGDDPPSSARLTIQGYVLRLRRALDGFEGVSIVTEPPGYRLCADPETIDLCRFERLLADGRPRDALALWRGEPLADVESESLRRDETPRLVELWELAVERRIDTDLAAGRHAELIGELTGLVAAHPLREKLRAQLMLALYRAGRQADALEAYRDARRTLVSELAVDPGPELRRLERAILVADPALDLAPDLGTERRPRMLPPVVPRLVGRDAEVARLLTPGSPPVFAVAGMAGVGKTALVVHAAHLLRDRHPDGQLYIDLGGAGDHPIEATAALDRFLRLLGQWAGRIPASLDERSALLRDRLANRRTLLVLDNAVDEAQVRPLLPGEPGCTVLITSRARLSGLDCACLIDLDVLAAEHAVDLLTGVIGEDRTRTEPDAARTLVGQCGFLPLAVRIAAARLASRPAWTLGSLAGQLADEHHRLDRLTAGDLEVRSSIALSHQALPDRHQRPFRLLGLLDLPDLTTWMVEALLADPSDAIGVVDALTDARLLEAYPPDATGEYRYRLHDLVRLFARERAYEAETAADRRAAVERVLRALLERADRADDSLPSRRLRLPEQRPAATGADLAPLEWFEANRHVLVAGVRQAGELGLAEPAWRLAAASLNFLDLRGHWDDWERTHQIALAACLTARDESGETAMRYGLGLLAAARDHYGEALDQLTACPPPTTPGALARIRNAIGDVHHICGRHAEARAAFEEALRVSTVGHDLTGQANSLLNLGLVHRDTDGEGAGGRVLDHDGVPASARSLAYLDRALGAFRAAGDEYGEANVLRFLAATYYYAGTDLPVARRYAFRATRIFHRLRDELDETRSLRLFAMALAAQRRTAPAVRVLEHCLATFRDQGDLFGEATTLWSLGRATDEAPYYERALIIFRRLNVPLWESRTLRRLTDAGAPPESSRGSC